MQKVYVLIFSLLSLSLSYNSISQSVLDPTDPIVTYDSAHKPTQPAWGQIGKWVRTVRLSWNTTSYKAYIYKGCAFRLKFPKTYNPTANDGKKYPMLVFFHGLGETGDIYDNEYQLYHGGDKFRDAVDNGQFDGYVLVMQSQGYWGANQYQYITEIIDYMVANNKLDAFQISDNGLSAGGQGTWEMLINHPTYISAAVPMSSSSILYEDQNTVNKIKFTPIWLFQGGLDGAPAPYTSKQVRDYVLAAGGDFKYTEYPDLAHGVWDRVWQEPDFYPFLLRGYASNPWTLYGRTEFCPGESINVTIGLPPGFDEYQWKKNGSIITGATSNTINVTDTASYSARVRRGTIWSDWSHTPAHIIVKAPTVTPPITVAGLMSSVIPSPDGKNYVSLQVADNGYISYTWKKVGSPDTISTNRIYTATQPGQYIVSVTEQYGCSSNYSAPFTVVNANGNHAPDPATNLTALTLSNTQVELDWSNSPTPVYNETAFEIYRSTTQGASYSFIGQVPADTITFTDKGLKPNVKYYYRIRAINNNGAAALSNEAFATTQSDKTLPTAPGNLRILSTTNTTVSLAWDSSTDNVGVDRYDVFVNGVKTNSTAQTTFILSGLNSAQQYSFYVKAKDISGNYSPQSNQVSAPTILQGFQYKYYEGDWSVLPNFNALTPVKTGTSANIDINSRNRDDQFGYVWQGFIRIPVAGTYTFETNSDDGSKMWLGKYDATSKPLVNNDGLHGTQFASGTVTLQPGVYPVSAAFFEQGGGQVMELYWTCSALFGDNNRHQITDQYFNDTYTPAGTAPLSPTNAAATALDYTRIRLTWADNSNNETGFEVYRSSNAAGPFNIVGTAGTNSTVFTDSALSPATTYYYKVIAINQYGSSSSGGLKYSYYEGTWDNLPDFNSLTPVKTGYLPNISLSPANGTTNYAFKYEGNISIPSTGQYTFYTKSDDGSKLYIGGFNSGNVVVNNDYLQGATERSGTITLNKGVYPIYITFFQKAGGYYLDASYQGPGIAKQLLPDSAFAAQAVSATTQNLPAAPLIATNVKATVKSASSIWISWKDNATNETGYNIYRSTGDSLHFKVLAALPVNTIIYKDSSLYAHITYYYKVAVTGVGGTSANSATVSGKTKDNLPVITDIASRSVRYGVTTLLTVTATDVDGDTLTYTILNKPAFAKLVSNTNNTATVTLNPKSTQQGVYNTSIVVNDKNGGKDTTAFTLTVNSNYDPSIDNVSNYTLNEGDSVNINLTGHDQNNDNLTWTVSNAPANSYITQSSSTTAVLHLHTNYSSAGAYNIQVNTTDGNGGATSQQFTLTVSDKNPNTTIYTRFMYDDPVGAPWNSITGTTTNNLKDSSNHATNVSLTFQTSSWLTYDTGPTTGNNSGVYPDAVLQDYYYFGIFGGPDSVAVKLSGLDKSLKYNLTFYAGSLFPGTPDNGNTTYTVGNQTVSLYVQNNTKNTVTIYNIVPDATGSIIFKMGKASNAAVGYLNALVINSVYDDGSAPLTPQLISAQNDTKGVRLTWQDLAYNEATYRVLRANSLNGSYAVIDSLIPANTTTYLDTTVTGNTQYYYKVRAFNIYGKSDFSDTLGVFVPDRTPALAAINNVVIKNNQQLTINVTATDDASDHITLKTSQLPPFVTFTDNGNGTGSFSIKPTAGTIGYYPSVTVTATDNSDSSASRSFDITVTDNITTGVYLNFSDGSVTAGKPWNNLAGYPSANKVFNNIVDQDNNATGITVTLVDGFQGAIASGMRPGNGRIIYPEAVLRTGEYEGTTAARAVKISGLSTSKKYNFVFFNSHEDGLNGTTNFTVNGQTVTLNASFNVDKTVEINNITPDVNGQVTVSVAKATGADYAYLSAMVIQSYDASVSILSPSDLRVTDTKRTSVSLQWADRSYNETGFDIYRADENNSTYSLIATVPANTVNYSDANLTANKNYYYIVKAKTASVTSNSSNTAVAHTLAYAVYVNFTTVNLAHSPWNNTAAPPQAGLTINNLFDEADHVTGLSLVDVSDFAGEYTAGMNTGNNSGIYPDSVMAESYGLFPGQTGVLKITGLNFNMKYNLTFFASSQAYGDVTISYTVNGKTVLLNASLNTKGNVTMYNVIPDSNGEVTISIAPGTSGSQFGLIGALVIQGFDASTPSVPVAPALQNTPVAMESGSSENAQKQVLQQNVGDIQIKAYPSPFINSFNVSVTVNQQNEDVSVQMYNMTGNLVYANKFGNLFKGENTLKIQPNVTASGAYIVKLTFSNEKTFKIVKILKQ